MNLRPQNEPTLFETVQVDSFKVLGLTKREPGWREQVQDGPGDVDPGEDLLDRHLEAGSDQPAGRVQDLQHGSSLEYLNTREKCTFTNEA